MMLPKKTRTKTTGSNENNGVRPYISQKLRTAASNVRPDPKEFDPKELDPKAFVLN